jgi:hypothetical protein
MTPGLSALSFENIQLPLVLFPDPNFFFPCLGKYQQTLFFKREGEIINANHEMLHGMHSEKYSNSSICQSLT